MLSVSPLYISLLALLIIFLAYRVTTFRRSEKISLGAENGSGAMKRAIRAHGNAVENVPIASILLVLLELNSINPILLHLFGLSFLLSRIAHAWGLSKRNGPSPGRFYGTLISWLTVLLMAVLNVYLVLIKL